MEERRRDFYERNAKGEAVNLFTRGFTLSGDLVYYDRNKHIAILTNSIQRVYNPDGTSQFVEFPGEFEFDTHIVHGRMVTTRGGRLGRIIEYNRDLNNEKRRFANGSTLENPLTNDSSTESDN